MRAAKIAVSSLFRFDHFAQDNLCEKYLVHNDSFVKRLLRKVPFLIG